MGHQSIQLDKYKWDCGWLFCIGHLCRKFRDKDLGIWSWDMLVQERIQSWIRIQVYIPVEFPNSLAGKRRQERCRPVYMYYEDRMEEDRMVFR